MPDSASPSAKAEIDAAEPQSSPEINTVFLGGLLLLALLTACYAAADIMLPIVLAFVLSAVCQPVLRLLERLGLPRVVAALAIVLSLVGLFVFVGVLLSGPIASWIAALPQTVPRLEARWRPLSALFRSLQHALARIEDLAPTSAASAAPPTVAVETTRLAGILLQAARTLTGGAFTTVLVLFFVLVSGDQFIRRLVEILPDFKRKRQAVDISHAIEEDISIYLATITLMNALVGIATGGMAALCGLGGPLLWGMVAFLLNFVPILGPTAGVMVFLVAGLVTIEPLWAAVVPAVSYLLIHVVEGETITPMLLAARFTVNPVLIVLGVIFWYWMWGVCGAVLATPMLAILKIVCDRIEALKPVGHFIGGEPIIFAANGKAAR